jgi:hypothetical protein
MQRATLMRHRALHLRPRLDALKLLRETPRRRVA